MEQLTIILFAITAFFFIRNLLLTIFHMENIKIHKKRLRQLKFEAKKETSADDLINTITRPVIEVIFPKLKIVNFTQIEAQLKFVGWNIGAKEFTALKIIAKVLGVIMFIFFIATSEKGLMIGGVWAGILMFLPQTLLTNSYKNKKEKIMLQFPDFIRMTQGFLTANLPIGEAIRGTAPFMNEEWQVILSKFSAKIATSDIQEALDFLKEEIGTLEIKEFISIVKLTIEQGGNARDGFEAQAEKVQEMLHDMMLIKISRRKIYGILVQAPLLLTNFAVLGIPVVETFMHMGF